MILDKWKINEIILEIKKKKNIHVLLKIFVNINNNSIHQLHFLTPTFPSQIIPHSVNATTQSIKQRFDISSDNREFHFELLACEKFSTAA